MIHLDSVELIISKRHFFYFWRMIFFGWTVDLIYLWLPNIEVSRSRVAERVAHGGHNIPDEAIVRRFPKSVANLLNHYAPLCRSTICLDNSGPVPTLIFTETTQGRIVENHELYEALQQGIRHD